jgi:hypothetical protein
VSRLALNSWSFCPSLQTARVTGMCHHTWLESITFLMTKTIPWSRYCFQF